MKVQIVNPSNAIGMIDPQTGKSPFIDAETRKVIEVAEVPDTVFWTRRVLDGEIKPFEEKSESTPTGREAVAPLTTR